MCVGDLFIHSFIAESMQHTDPFIALTQGFCPELTLGQCRLLTLLLYITTISKVCVHLDKCLTVP